MITGESRNDLQGLKARNENWLKASTVPVDHGLNTIRPKVTKTNR